jgi:hypothetical protein
MHIRTILPLFALVCVLAIAEEPKPKPAAPAADTNDAWLAAIERIRAMPFPGEFKNAGLEADLEDVFELNDAAKLEVVKIQNAYSAELLQRAAKWAEEEKALRAEYEAKALQAVPEARREAAKKALEFSHNNWTPTLERDGNFKKEFASRVAELRENRAKLSVDELNEAREKMHAWVRETRDKLALKDEDTIKNLKALLAADEAERLQKLVKLRVPEQEAPPTAPGVDTKDPKKDPKKKK